MPTFNDYVRLTDLLRQVNRLRQQDDVPSREQAAALAAAAAAWRRAVK